MTMAAAVRTVMKAISSSSETWQYLGLKAGSTDGDNDGVA